MLPFASLLGSQHLGVSRGVVFINIQWLLLHDTQKIQIVALAQQRTEEHCACKHPRFNFYKADWNMRSLIDQWQNWSLFKFLLHVNILVRLYLDKACLHVPHRLRYSVPVGASLFNSEAPAVYLKLKLLLWTLFVPTLLHKNRQFVHNNGLFAHLECNCVFPNLWTSRAKSPKHSPRWH